MDRPVAIFLCSRTDIMARPWADAGIECICVDTQHSIRKDRREGNITFVWGDVRSWYPPAGTCPIFVAAFTPCTELAVSGARDHQKKRGWMLADALQLFDSAMMAAEWSGAPFMLENSVGRLSTHRRKPDYYFQPWEYGDPWFKQTCIWAGNGFVMPPKQFTEPPEGTTEKIWKMAPSDDRADLRAETPPGFARAVFEANRPKLPTMNAPNEHTMPHGDVKLGPGGWLGQIEDRPCGFYIEYNEQCKEPRPCKYHPDNFDAL